MSVAKVRRRRVQQARRTRTLAQIERFPKRSPLLFGRADSKTDYGPLQRLAENA